MFLNKKELIELTGYKFRNLQIRWLSERGYKFDISANGNPVVLIAYVNERLGGLGGKARRIQEPDFSSKAFGYQK